MNTLRTIHGTAWLSHYLYWHAFPLYAVFYDAYKRLADRGHIRMIRSLLKPGDRVVDVGANVGFYACLLARLVGPCGVVHAFEPDPVNFAHLCARVRRHPWVRPVQAAVTDYVGAAELYLSPDLNVDHRTYPTDDPRPTVAVRAVSLDAFLAGEEPLDFVKLDIQGAEYGALLGMQEIVARSPDLKILMELWPHVHDRFGAGTATLLGLLESWGLELHRVTDGGEVGERILARTWVGAYDADTYFDVLATRSTPG